MIPVNIAVNAIDNATAVLQKVRFRLDAVSNSMKGLNVAMSQITFVKDLNAVNLSLNHQGRIIDMNTKKFISFDGAAKRMLGNLGDGLGKANKQVRTFDMRLLSVLFAGMALQRTFGSALRSLFDNYKKVGAEQSVFNIKTMELNASWTFLKFSIIDALSQSSLFTGFIDFVIDLITWVSDLTSRFPGIGTDLVVAFSVLAAGGTVMVAIAQFKLFWDATFGIGGFLAKKTAAGMGASATASGTVAGSVGAGMALLGKIVAGGVIIWMIAKALNKEAGSPWTAQDMFDITFAGIAGWSLGGPLGAFAAAFAVLTIKALKDGTIDEIISNIQEKLLGKLNLRPGGYTAGGFSEALQSKLFNREQKPSSGAIQAFETGGGYTSQGSIDLRKSVERNAEATERNNDLLSLINQQGGTPYTG